jgi:hypothetical protein
MEPIEEATKCYDQMLIVEKYEKVVSYLYPIAQNIPRKHGVARDMFLRCLLGQVELFIAAGKSNQVSRLYQADAGLAMLRFWLRVLTGILKPHAMSPHQAETAQVLLAEVGCILGAWIKRVNRKGRAGN